MSSSAKEIWPEVALEQVALTVEVVKENYVDDQCYLRQKGWARFTKAVVLTENLTEEEAGKLGTLLYAEWIDAADTPCRIAPDPASPGQFKRYAFREGLGDTYMKEQVSVFGDGAAHAKKLNFTVYWQDKGDGAIARGFDVFTGFATEGTK